MATIIEKTGKTVEDALQAALTELGAGKEDVDYEILENPSKGFLGLIGVKPARVKVKLKEIPPAQAEPEKISDFEVKISPEENNPAEVEADSEEKIDLAEEISSDEPPELADAENSNFDRTTVIEAAENFLQEVFSAMNIDVQISAEETESEVIFDLSGKNLGVLIGKHGQTLDALQYLTNLAVNRNGAPERIHFVLDVENYRERRMETLKKLAKNVADRAIRTRQDVRLEPMNRHERRIIHTVLQNNDRVETHSAGEDPYRYVIVTPKRRAKSFSKQNH